MSVTSRRLAVATLIAFGIGSIGTQLNAGAQEPAVVRGGANASADSMGFQIINAGASLGWTFGRSTAAYRDITASSEGKAVDLGAVEALFSQPQCGGEVPPALNMETLPPRTIADSAVKGSEVAKSAEVIYPRLAGDNAGRSRRGYADRQRDEGPCVAEQHDDPQPGLRVLPGRGCDLERQDVVQQRGPPVGGEGVRQADRGLRWTGRVLRTHLEREGLVGGRHGHGGRLHLRLGPGVRQLRERSRTGT